MNGVKARYPSTFTDDLSQLYLPISRFTVISNGIAYSLTVFIGLPLNLFIITRLLDKELEKTKYLCLIIFMSFNDIYMSLFGMGSFCWQIYMKGIDNFLFSDYAGFLTIYVILFAAPLQMYLELVIIIHWKTVVESKPCTDKFLYALGFLPNLIYLACIAYIIFINPERSNLVYFILFLYIIVYTVISGYSFIRVIRTTTAAFSDQTLRIYWKMTLAHFLQCLLIEIDAFLTYFVYVMVIFYNEFVFAPLAKKIHDDEEALRLYTTGEQKMAVHFLFIMLAIQYSFKAIKPCLRPLLIFASLRGLLKEKEDRVTVLNSIFSVHSLSLDNPSS